MRDDPIPRAYAGRDDVAEAHDDVIDDASPAVAEADVRRSVLAVRMLADAYEDSWCRLEGDWPEMADAIRGLFALDLGSARATPAEGAEKPGGAFDKRGADRLARCVADLVRRRVIDMRSPAADALLDYDESLCAGPLLPVAPLARPFAACPVLGDTGLDPLPPP